MLPKAFRRLFQVRRKYTQCGMALWRLTPKGPVQFSLFREPEDTVKGQSVQASLDVLHERFGRNSITRGSALSVKSGTKRNLGMNLVEGG